MIRILKNVSEGTNTVAVKCFYH